MPEFTVMVTDDRHGDYSIEENILRDCGAALEVKNCRTEEDVIRICKKADGLLLDLAPMPARVVMAMEKVRVISRYGVGYDNVDPEACTRKKIYLANVPDYCEEDVSDLALAHIFCSLRQIVLKDKLIRQGKWNLGRENIFRIKGKTLSIIGYGRSGRCLHRKVSALGLGEVLVCDPYVDPALIEKNGAKPVNLSEALSKADIVTLHIPLTKETDKIMNADAFGRMKKTAVFVNTSRGGVLDHQALVKALQTKQIAFAGLDNHHVEPLPGDDPLLTLDNCVLTDHTGFNTQEGVRELKTKVAENVKAVLTGGVPRYWINTF
ncbi:MAG: C-terminal binding protein [Spirochaetales bacterium]|nr:C-terminal binding protein [Spirochaetales bacterium]